MTILKDKENFTSELNKAFINYLNSADTAEKEYRKNALDVFMKSDFPTLNDEDWNRTNIAPILGEMYFPQILLKDNLEEEIKYRNEWFKDNKANILVFVDGFYNSKNSKIIDESEGLFIGSLSELKKDKNVKFLNEAYKRNDIIDAFDAMNGAFAADGFVIVIPSDYEIKYPVLILNYLGSYHKRVLAQTKNIIAANKNSKAQIIEAYLAADKERHFGNISADIYLEKNSSLDYYKVQRLNKESFFIERNFIKQKADSKFRLKNFAFGGSISRQSVKSSLNESGASCELYGLNISEGEQLIDNHTVIEHNAPYCESNQFYKGILADKSRGVFSGKVYVKRDAQKTNAYQSNKSLLLSDEARVDSKPQLEIYADDVKCSHGAAIGQLEDEALFYMQSRGIPEKTARFLLIKAFANDVSDKIYNEELKRIVNKIIFDKLGDK